MGLGFLQAVNLPPPPAAALCRSDRLIFWNDELFVNNVCTSRTVFSKKKFLNQSSFAGGTGFVLWTWVKFSMSNDIVDRGVYYT